MNKKHIATSIGVVLLTTGIVGGIWSGIHAMPSVLNRAQLTEQEYNKEEIIYNSELNLTKLNIESDVADITIKEYNGKDVIVGRTGNKELRDITVKEKDNELTIKEEYNDERSYKDYTKSIDAIVEYFLNQLYMSYQSEITVYVPENIDLNVNNNSGTLYLADDTKFNDVDYYTKYGSMSVSDNAKIKNLNIKSSSSISLLDSEVYCAENINIEAYRIDINSNDNIIKNRVIPESIILSAPYEEYEHDNIFIGTTLPLAKNLTINSSSIVDLDLPLLEYKFVFDIKTSKGIDFNEYYEQKYKGTPLEEHFKYNENEYEGEGIRKLKEIKGLINEQLVDETSDYNITIKSAGVRFN